MSHGYFKKGFKVIKKDFEKMWAKLSGFTVTIYLPQKWSLIQHIEKQFETEKGTNFKHKTNLKCKFIFQKLKYISFGYRSCFFKIIILEVTILTTNIYINLLDRTTAIFEQYL